MRATGPEFFTQEELSKFWWPGPAERAEWDEYWRFAQLESHANGDMPEPPWDFKSMISMITRECDYDLIGARRIDQLLGVLEFKPLGHPYGGTAALRALVRAFGHVVTGYDDGTGYVAGDPTPPLWTPKNMA